MVRSGFTPNPNDLIIMLMGPTGSGRSNFINRLTGRAETHSAGGLKSDTQVVVPHAVMRNGLRIVLADTPGFDNTYRSDTDILRVIADWLTQKYPNGDTLKAAGILYFHRITDKHVSGSVYKNLQMFSRLCGDSRLRRTRLVTTMWDTARDPGRAQQNEEELKNEFWRQLLDEGAVAERFNNTDTSAWAIVQALLNMGREDDGLLQLQEELVGQNKHLNETEAAKVLYSRYQLLLVEQKKTLKELADGAKAQNDPILAKSLQDDYEKISVELQKTFEEMKEVKLPFTVRIHLWLFGWKPRGRGVRVD